MLAKIGIKFALFNILYIGCKACEASQVVGLIIYLHTCVIYSITTSKCSITRILQYILKLHQLELILSDFRTFFFGDSNERASEKLVAFFTKMQITSLIVII